MCRITQEYVFQTSISLPTTKQRPRDLNFVITVSPVLNIIFHLLQTESQQRVIERLKEENSKLLEKIKQGGKNDLFSMYYASK